MNKIVCMMRFVDLRQRGLRLLTAIAVAGVVNALLFWGVALLNRGEPAPPREPADQPVRYVLAAAEPPPPEPVEQPPQAAPEPAPPSPTSPAPPSPTPAAPSPRTSKPSLPALDLPPTRRAPLAVATPAAPPTEPPTPRNTGTRQTTRSTQGHDAAAGGTGQSSGHSRGPRLLHKPRLRYSGHAFSGDRQGRVVVRLQIDEQGRVQNADLIRVEQGPRVLGEVMMRAIDRFRFAPARRDGEPVAETQTMRIRVQLE